MLNAGKFVSFEGGEGVGKSSNLNFAAEQLRQQGLSVIVTREPGGTEIGEQIRDVLLKQYESSVHSHTELLLLFAARAQHLEQVIKPALQRGDWVISDRFTDASYAYQGGGRGIEQTRIEHLENWLLNGLQPDLTLLLDAPVEIAMTRVSQRGAIDRFESQETAFFTRVRDAYLARAQQQPQRIRVIDASLTLQQVQAQVRQVLTTFCQQVTT